MEPVRTMVIDSVHSSAEGRMHAGQIRRMRIVRPLPIFEAHALKTTSTGLVEEKNSSTVNLESRPSLVIRRRIMVPHLDAATDSPALSNSSTTTNTNTGSQVDKKPTDLTRSHLDVILSRSSTQDQTVCKLSATTASQPPKTIHLFDLNELPGLPDCPSAAESPTSTIASAHSTAHDGASTALTVPEVKLFSGVEGDGAKLAVDLGLLPKTPHAEGDLSMQGAADLATPPRKRLRKLSEYQPTHDSLAAATVHGGEVCVRTTPEPEVKKAVVVDDEVLGAASVLMTLSLPSSKKRYLDSIAEGESGGFFWDEDEAGPSTAAGSETTSSRSLGSSGSVLLRPSNKQRYRSMGELMTQAPGLKRG